MVIETFLNIFLCYSSLQCNRIPYFSPKHYAESNIVGNTRQYTVHRCNETAIPKVFLRDVCRCIPEIYYGQFISIKNRLRLGMYNGFQMNCTEVFNGTDSTAATSASSFTDKIVQPRVAPSKISQVVTQFLRSRGVPESQIAEIQATGLTETHLERLGARRRLNAQEINDLRRKGVSIQQINGMQFRGLLPSEIRLLRSNGLLPPPPQQRPLNNPRTQPRIPSVTPIRAFRPQSVPNFRRPVIGPRVSPALTPIRRLPRPVTKRPQISRFQELQLLSRRLSPLQLVFLVRELPPADISSIEKEMTDKQFIAMWKILKPEQKQQLLQSLTPKRKALLQTQTPQQSVKAFQPLLTPQQIQQLSPKQLQRLLSILSTIDGDKGQLPTASEDQKDPPTGPGLPFRASVPTASIDPITFAPDNSMVDTSPSEPQQANTPTPPIQTIGRVVLPTGETIPIDGNAATDVPTPASFEENVPQPSIGTGGTPIDTSGNVVDINIPSPSSILTSNDLNLNNMAMNPASTNTDVSMIATPDTESNLPPPVPTAEPPVIVNKIDNSETITPNYRILENSGPLSPEICADCEATQRVDHCYLPHPESCSMFVQCVTDSGTKLRPQAMLCHPYMFWNGTVNNCIETYDHCKTPLGLEHLPREPAVEAPVFFDSTTKSPEPKVSPTKEPETMAHQNIAPEVVLEMAPPPPARLQLLDRDIFPDVYKIILEENDVCLTTDCVRAAAVLANSIDTTADPCQDFYQFACGRWTKRNVLKEDESSTGSFRKVREGVQITLKYLLEQPVLTTDLDAVRKAKHMYQSCVDEKTIDSTAMEDGLRLIEELGGWPVLGNKRGGQTTPLSLEDLLVKAAKNSIQPILSMFVYDDTKDIENNILYIDQPSLGMPSRRYYLRGRNHRMLKAYEKYAVEMAKAFGADPSTAEQHIKDMVDFEIVIANMTMPPDQRRNAEKLYNKMTIEELEQKYGLFNWQYYFNQILGQPEIGYTVTPKESLIVRNPNYMSRIFTYLNSLGTQGQTILSNYVIWRSISAFALALPTKIRDLHQDYRRVILGSRRATPRWRACVGYTNGGLGFAVGRLFLAETFDTSAKNDTLQMIRNLRSAMNGLLKGNKWMDAQTKRVAIEKLQTIESRIGFPDEVMDDTFLNNRYINHTVTLDSYFNNTLDSTRNSVFYYLRKLRQKVDRTKWETGPATVNAYYSPSRNQIIFPAGILQPPFYHKNYPKYLNYGGIGYIIGHEITHGFDDNGRRYDKVGKLNEWWTNSSIENFKVKAKCMEDQYSGYTVKEANRTLNGKLTLGENIADNGGLKESYIAYQKWVRENGVEPKLPGLNYTQNQLFFLNAAHLWCGIVRPEQAIRLILVDTHSDSKSRTNGPASNSEEFAKAFNCPLGSPLNPRKKCEVW